MSIQDAKSKDPSSSPLGGSYPPITPRNNPPVGRPVSHPATPPKVVKHPPLTPKHPTAPSHPPVGRPVEQPGNGVGHGQAPDNFSKSRESQQDSQKGAGEEAPISPEVMAGLTANFSN